jgi:ABC-type multidrug transport system ATPase subunit
MQLKLDQVGKRFNKDWIFRNLTLTIESNSAWAITGPNGSGKSTLIQILSTFIDPTEGSILYDNVESPEYVSQIVSFTAPYVNIIEELTLVEHLNFHFTFKKKAIELKEMAQRAGLEKAWNKPVKDFSSGMKQRLKLCFALFSNSSLILLDEPTANMDESGIAWYKKEIDKIIGKATIIIASNQRYEYEFSSNYIDLTSYKYTRKKKAG